MKLLLALDDSKFSQAAANIITEQFRPQGNQVRVLHVVEPVVLSEPPQMARGYYPEVTDRIPQAEKLVQQTAQALSSAGFSVTTSVIIGDARNVILDVAGEWKADLIIVGSHGRTGLGRFFLGSVSEAVARHALCSVQIVRTPK